MRAVITGGTRGIGLKTAVTLGKAGYEIIITGIDNEAAETALKELKDNQIKGEFIYADSMNEEDVNRCFEEISQKYDSLDVLVNNVGGLGGRQRFEDMETSFMRRVMALNFDSAFFASRAAIPLLKKAVTLPLSTSVRSRLPPAAAPAPVCIRPARRPSRASRGLWPRTLQNMESGSTPCPREPLTQTSTQPPRGRSWRHGRMGS